MNIGIDISQAAYEGTGVGNYTKGLINSILDYDTKNSWTFLFFSFRSKLSPTLIKKINSSKHRFISIPFPASFLSFLWNTLHIVPVETFTGPLDLFISSDWTEPPAHCKKITIVHDLVYLRYPETVHPTILTTQRKRMSWVQKESTHIIATSQATKNDIVSFLHIPEQKITSIYTGISSLSPTQDVINDVKQKYNITQPFILAVGKVEPRKNISRLIDAFKMMGKPAWSLIVAGPQGWDMTSKQKKDGAICFTGLVTDKELHALYELSDFFILPSLWEGFGHPIIEAMQHKKAVITSNIPSLVEVSGGNALLCDPQSVESIKNAMVQYIDDSNLRNNNAKKGYMYSQQFTWKRYYQELMNSINYI